MTKKSKGGQPDDLPPLLELMALRSASEHQHHHIDQLSRAIGWALAHAERAHTPEWKIELMIRAGWLPDGKQGSGGIWNN